MKLNNKGFAASVILYSAIAVLVIILILILSIYATNTHNKTTQADFIKEKMADIELNE